MVSAAVASVDIDAITDAIVVVFCVSVVGWAFFLSVLVFLDRCCRSVVLAAAAAVLLIITIAAFCL